MSKEIAVKQQGIEMLQALRNTVAPGLTEPEFRLFAEMCKATGLNPATKEIWAIKANGRLQLMTGINGFLRIANSHPAFDGMEVSFEWDEKQLVSCTVKVHRKDRKYPSVATAYLNEYGKQTPIWKQMPTVMLSKCAKSLAIREAFIQELGGLYTQEEMPNEFAAAKSDIKEPEVMFVDTNTGEIDDLPNWDKKPKAQPTFYDLGTLGESQRAAAEKYLAECEAVKILPYIWRAPIRLKKLTQCITEDYRDETEAEKSVLDN